MEKANQNKKNNLTSSIWIGLFLFLIGVTGANAQTPTIYSITPQFIQQGQITIATIEGENLNSTTVGIQGGDIFAVILNQDPEGMSLTVQLAARPTAEPSERELLLRNTNGEETTFPISVIPTGSPVVDTVYPNLGAPGCTHLLQVTGERLNSPLVATSSEHIIVNSFRESGSDGRVLLLSLSIAANAPTNTKHSIFVNTIGGQAQFDFFVAEENINDDSTFDPRSSFISSVEVNEEDSSSILIRGARFEEGDVVTILEDVGGTVISRQVSTDFISNDQLSVHLPSEINLNDSTISFAVSGKDGRASNIKAYGGPVYNPFGSSYTDTDTVAMDTSTSSDTSSNDTVAIDTTTSDDTTTIGEDLGIDNGSTDIAADTTTSDSEANSIASETTTDEPLDGTNEIAADTTSTVDADAVADNSGTTLDPIEDNQLAVNPPSLGASDNASTQNLQGVANVVIDEKTKESITLDDLNDPENLINTIEKEKQAKSKGELLDIALEDAKDIKDKDLQNAIEKTEEFKAKVEELEKLLEVESNKNKPDKRKLASYKKLLANANAESRSQTFELLNNLLKYKPQLKYQLTQKPFDLAAIQPNLPTNAAIIQYVPTDEGLIVFVVDKENLKVRVNKNITKAKLNAHVKNYRALMENEIEKINATGRVTPVTSWKRSGTKLYRQEIKPIKRRTISLYRNLIKPIEEDIADKQVVAIIANGWLRYLPFQSLAKIDSRGDLNFLISNKSIVYLDSVLALSRIAPDAITQSSSVTVFANPDGSLKGAVKEAQVISSLFSMSTNALINKPFDKSIINQVSSKTDILHLATHGHFNGTNIGSSFLVTGKKTVGKKTRIQKLYLKDIYDLNLKNSKLVVLSGCDTGKIGKLSDEPEDLVGGLATAFRVAGANTILASLWQAHDEATNILMKNFYSNLKAGQNKAEALRKAQMVVMKNPKYKHPLFWSTFNLMGDWR